MRFSLVLGSPRLEPGAGEGTLGVFFLVKGWFFGWAPPSADIPPASPAGLDAFGDNQAESW
jgi:hypothetical protein